MTENYNLVRIGYVGNSVPVEVALYRHVMGGFAEPARVLLTSDFHLDLPAGFPNFTQGTELVRTNPLPAGSILDLPVPVAAALVELGAATNYIPPAGYAVATAVDPADGISKPIKSGTTDNTPFAIFPVNS